MTPNHDSAKTKNSSEGKTLSDSGFFFLGLASERADEQKSVLCRLSEQKARTETVITLAQQLLGDTREARPPEYNADVTKLLESAVNILAHLRTAIKECYEDFANVDLAKKRHAARNLLNLLLGYCQLLEEQELQLQGPFIADLKKIHDLCDQCTKALGGGSDNAPPPVPPRLLARPGHLLVVDDEECSRDLFRRLLSPHGHRFTEVCNGLDAIDKMTNESFDLVLLDLGLPDVGGLQILQHFEKRSDKRQNTILVISATVDDPNLPIRCIELGAEDYLTKPINHVHLQARVNACLQKRQFHLREFEQFFPTKVAQDWMYRRDELKKGRQADVTVLFCDIRDFSSISEKSNQNTISWLNEVMERLSDCVLKKEGVLVDFQGDELMAMWGAPDDQENHAKLACEAALEMLTEIKKLDEKWRSRIDDKQTHVGIGINSGSAFVGNTGTSKRFKYGPLGNTVNLAHRVQGANKHLKSNLLITRNTRRLLGDAFALRRVSKIKVVNIAEPVEVFEVVPHGQPEWPERKQRFEQALAFFEDDRLKEASEIFGKLVTQYEAQGPELALLHRTVECLVDHKKYSKVWDLPSK